MTRDEAKEIALKAIEKEIELHGEDYIYILAPQKGKNSWTLREAKESILEDKELENSNTNLIDGILNLDKYMKEQAKKTKENEN
jgi:hypothetical protein